MLEFEKKLAEESQHNVSYLRPVRKFTVEKLEQWFCAVDKKKRGRVTRNELWKLLQHRTEEARSFWAVLCERLVYEERVKMAENNPGEYVDAQYEQHTKHEHSFRTRLLRDAFATLDEIVQTCGNFRMSKYGKFEVLDKKLALLYFEAHDLIAPLSNKPMEGEGDLMLQFSGGLSTSFNSEVSRFSDHTLLGSPQQQQLTPRKTLCERLEELTARSSRRQSKITTFAEM